jgi:hypothetical protein
VTFLGIDLPRYYRKLVVYVKNKGLILSTEERVALWCYGHVF